MSETAVNPVGLADEDAHAELYELLVDAAAEERTPIERLADTEEAAA